MSTLRAAPATDNIDAAIFPMSSGDAAACAALLQRCLAAMPGVGVRRIEPSEIHALLGRAEVRSAALRVAGRLAGVAIWSHLAWDSRLLGHRSARIWYLTADGDPWRAAERKRTLVSHLVARCEQERIRYVVARVSAADVAGIHALEDSGFRVADGILTFALSLDGLTEGPASPDVRIRHATDDDIGAVREIARTAYAHDRFHTDPRIPPAVADELYAAWAENSCRGVAADAVLLAADGERVVGFVTCKIGPGHTASRVGTIVLVATAAHSRGRGVARALTRASLSWFRSQGVDTVEVGTQLANVAAARLYERCGFRLAASHLSLRKWLDA